MNGYMFVQTVAEFEREPRHLKYDEPVTAARMSYAVRGWYQIERCIKSGEFFKISAERLGVKVEARFNIVKNEPGGDNGSYEIKGGLFAGNGVFRNISKRENCDFKEFYVCHAVSAGGKNYLRWQVGVADFVDADKIADEEPN